MSVLDHIKTSSLPLWWGDRGSFGLCGYIGATSGLEYVRHSSLCEPGKWRVSVTNWGHGWNAVVDDFGNL